VTGRFYRAFNPAASFLHLRADSPKSGRYQAPPVRRTYIPKAAVDSTTTAILYSAIGAVHDRAGSTHVQGRTKGREGGGGSELAGA